MATLTYPGVYVEEVSSGVRPIQSVSTSIPAFIGIAEMGPLQQAVKVYNFTEYQKLYGGFLDGSFLSHSVYQFFSNGGSQCYVVRVGQGMEAANIVLKSRETGAGNHTTLTISAKTPGIWGNHLAIQIKDGTYDPANEFNLSVYRQEKPDSLSLGLRNATLLEGFDNLSMVTTSSNFVETRIAVSQYIQITVTPGDAAADQLGSSRGASAPDLPLNGKTKFQININGDGYQEVELSDNPGDLDAIAAAIQTAVIQLEPQQASTDVSAFSGFTCVLDDDVLLLTSGSPGATSSVAVLPAQDSADDASAALKLGVLNKGVETIGASVIRPHNTRLLPYLLGDDTPDDDRVESVQAGSDGDFIENDQPFIGALSVLDPLEDVSLIAIPGQAIPSIVGAGMNYAANRPLSDCFFLGEVAASDTTVEQAQAFAAQVTPKNSYGAVYTPWIQMLDPTGKSPNPILVPPSGYVAGLYAKTDSQRGVWKAPAGVNVGLGGAVGLATNFTDVQQGNLNNQNINVIRQFAASGIVLWGARTLTADQEWLYIPVRRMAIFLRVSIYRGIQWAVFEPNDEPLWSQLRLNLNSFMMTLFRQGAFQGSTPSQAFFVKCDSETTTQDDINLGIVNVVVGFAPLKPAEFVVVQISQKAGEAA